MTIHRTYDESEESFWDGEVTNYKSTPSTTLRISLYVYRYFPNPKYCNTPELMASGWINKYTTAFNQTLGDYDDSRGVGNGDFANKKNWTVKLLDQKWPEEIIKSYTTRYESNLGVPDMEKFLQDNHHFTEFEVHHLKDKQIFNRFSIQAGNVHILAVCNAFNIAPIKMRPIVEKMIARLPRNGEIPSPFKLTFKPSQVIDLSFCQTWIKGKPAVLRAGLEWEDPKIREVEAKVQFFCNGKPLSGGAGGMNIPADGKFIFQSFFAKEKTAAKHRLSQDTANLIFTPSTTGKIQISAEVTPLSVDGKPLQSAKTLKATAEANVEERCKIIRFHFMPIAVGEWAGKDRMDDGEFLSAVTAQREFISSMLPLPPDQVITYGTSTMLKPESAPGELISGQTRSGLLARLQSIYQPGQVDIAVGLVPEKWLGDIGITEPARFPNAILLEIGQMYEPALAHEYMHLLCFSHYQPKTISWTDTAGVCVTKPTLFYRKDCIWGQNANTALTEIMSEDIDHANAIWIHKDNYRQLLKLLQNNQGLQTSE